MTRPVELTSWVEVGFSAPNRLMTRALSEIEAGDYPEALRWLDEIDTLSKLRRTHRTWHPKTKKLRAKIKRKLRA